MTETKLLILDKDGTLVRPQSGGSFVKSPDDQELLPGVLGAVQDFADAGWKVVIASNQGGVQAGYKTMESAVLEMQYCLGLIPYIKTGYLCPDGLTDTWQRKLLSRAGLNKSTCVVVTSTGSHSVPEWFCDEDMIQKTGAAWGRPRSYRKPDGLMLFLAALDISPYPDSILMVGDREEDMLAAHSIDAIFMDAQQWRDGCYQELLNGL